MRTLILAVLAASLLARPAPSAYGSIGLSDDRGNISARVSASTAGPWSNTYAYTSVRTATTTQTLTIAPCTTSTTCNGMPSCATVPSVITPVCSTTTTAQCPTPSAVPETPCNAIIKPLVCPAGCTPILPVKSGADTYPAPSSKPEYKDKNASAAAQSLPTAGKGSSDITKPKKRKCKKRKTPKTTDSAYIPPTIIPPTVISAPISSPVIPMDTKKTPTVPVPIAPGETADIGLPDSYYSGSEKTIPLIPAITSSTSNTSFDNVYTHTLPDTTKTNSLNALPAYDKGKQPSTISKEEKIPSKAVYSRNVNEYQGSYY